MGDNMNAEYANCAVPSSPTFSALNVKSVAPAPRALAQVTADGEVLIDWGVVQECLHDPNCDRTTKVVAAIAMAVRDGTWKPLGR
jgi:hypothetical protein